MSKIRRLRLDCGAEFLADNGAMLHVSWGISSVFANELNRHNRPIPEPIQGHILVDTGATNTCITVETAQRLHLKPIGLVLGYGAGGAHTNEIYRANLRVFSHTSGRSDGPGKVFVSGIDMTVQGIPELGTIFEESPVYLHGRRIILVGLLGRDFLRRVDMRYDGRGRMSMRLLSELTNERSD